MTTVLRQILTASHDPALRLAEQAPLRLEAAASSTSPDDLPQLMVNSAHRFQALEGFGGAFTEAAATTWAALPAEEGEALLRAYFGNSDAAEGHGYALCRVHMNSCDFSLGNYAHADVPGDVELKHFNIDRDRQALLPMIKAAQKLSARPIKLMVSPWSPPAWMKTNGEMNNGGRLKAEYAAAWARCYVRFIEAYEAEGVPIWGLSVQNEPMAVQRWDSCIYSAEEERDFIRDHLGPALEKAGLWPRVKIVCWDHNRDQMVERASAVYGDPAAAKYVWGCGFHWYVEDAFDHVRLVHDAWPDKALLFTEGCQEGGPHHGSWALGERYARSIISDLNRWTVGWIDWNLLLDESGGPNHVGNLCSAPVLVKDGALSRQSSYYYLGHFARFIAPGARRVLCAATRQVIEATAFVNPDGDLAVVAMNRSEAAVRFSLLVDGRRAIADLPARSIATYVTH